MVGGEPKILVDGSPVLTCFFLVASIDPVKGSTIDTIDELSEIKGARIMEGRDVINEFGMTEDDVIMAHASNLQAWVENGYDTRILHSNLAFTLLKMLSRAGDKAASRALEREVSSRIRSRYLPVMVTLVNCCANVITPESWMIISESGQDEVMKEIAYQMAHGSAYRTVFVEKIPDIAWRRLVKEDSFLLMVSKNFPVTALLKIWEVIKKFDEFEKKHYAAMIQVLNNGRIPTKTKIDIMNVFKEKGNAGSNISLLYYLFSTSDFKGWWNTDSLNAAYELVLRERDDLIHGYRNPLYNEIVEKANTIISNLQASKKLLGSVNDVKKLSEDVFSSIHSDIVYKMINLDLDMYKYIYLIPLIKNRLTDLEKQQMRVLLVDYIDRLIKYVASRRTHLYRKADVMLTAKQLIKTDLSDFLTRKQLHVIENDIMNLGF
jgi:hypothetical protein